MRRTILLAVVLGLCVVVVALITWSRLTVDTPPPPAAATSTPHQPSVPASRPPSPPAVAVPVPDPLTAIPDPRTADPETVAKQALTIMFSPQPGIDRSGGDAYRRAASWLSPRMQTESAARPNSGPGAQWDDWQARHVTIVAHVELGCSGCRPDTPTTVQRVATIIQFAADPAGHTRAENALTAWVTIARQQDGWRVDTLAF